VEVGYRQSRSDPVTSLFVVRIAGVFALLAVAAQFAAIAG
jgi:hypothetical protein